MPVAGRSLGQQKLIAYAQMMRQNEGFWNSILIFLGALSLFTAIPFYPLPVAVILAILCGFAGYSKPPLGVGATWILALPAFAFQSTVWGWLGLLLLALVFFEMFTNWGVIALLEIICLAPFAAFPFSIFGGFVYLLMVWGGFHFGSRKSVAISVPGVFIILLLSSVWLVQNSAYLPLTLSNYEPGVEQLALKPGPVGITELGLMDSALGNLANFGAISNVWEVLGKLFSNGVTILISDLGILQLAAWGVALYLVGMLSGTLQKGKWTQTKASLALLIVPVFYFFISFATAFAFRWEMALYSVLSIAAIAFADFSGLKISKERMISAKEKLKTFGKFGLQDMSLGGGESGLEDFGGYGDVKKELEDSILLPLQSKELASAYGLRPPSGILMFGPPGTGKTMLMRALAKELDFRMYYVKSSDILSQWFGESEKNISEIFSKARANAPAILFFDEIDSIGKKRTAGGMDDVTPRVLSVLLQEMDGLKEAKAKPVIVVGATNIPNKLDFALMRPGRFDKIIYMHLPDREARKEIFKVHMRKLPVAPDIDYEKLAAKSERFSGADIKNVVTEALGIAANEAKREKKIIPINMGHLLYVLEHTKPSTTFAQLEDYDEFRTDFERSLSGPEKMEVEEKVGKKEVRWEDVADLGDVKQAFREAIEIPLLHPKLFKEFKVTPIKGILMFGPPGCGKTLIARAAANELDITFLLLSGAQLMKRGYTQAMGVIKETFNRARENPPSVIFIDEIETIAPSREQGRVEITGQFLTEMDGIRGLKGVVIVGATNRPAMLDPAILRPGRFDKIIYVHPPDELGREELFKIHLGEFAKGLDLGKLASFSEGFSGADIASVAQEVKMYLLKEKLGGKDAKVNTDVVIAFLSHRRPSITHQLLMEYERFIQEYGERK